MLLVFHQKKALGTTKSEKVLQTCFISLFDGEFWNDRGKSVQKVCLCVCSAHTSKMAMKVSGVNMLNQVPVIHFFFGMSPFIFNLCLYNDTLRNFC